jgi:GNAT superfamily N-acetyltransferase
MSAAPADVIRWGSERARTGAWQGDLTTAFLFPMSQGSPPSPEFLRRCLDQLAECGYRRVVTGALTPHEQGVFFDMGFEVREQLRLLTLDLRHGLPPLPPGLPVRRVGPKRRTEVLAVDAMAFEPFWQLDDSGLREAMVATPRRRLRAAVDGRRTVVGYAVCGLADRRGFVQRLAVRPGCRGQGTGRRLLLDGLHWMARRGAVTVAVNTQMTNEQACRLYRRVGFRDAPAGLSVLAASL